MQGDSQQEENDPTSLYAQLKGGMSVPADSYMNQDYSEAKSYQQRGGSLYTREDFVNQASKNPTQPKNVKARDVEHKGCLF